MILSDEGIKHALSDGIIELDPPPEPDHYSPSAVDILLGAASTFRRWRLEALTAPGIQVVLNLAEQKYVTTANQYAKSVTPENDGSIILPPYAVEPQLLLCQTHQRLHLKPESKLAARVEGRSQMARLGLMVHLTAPTIHTTFTGTITLELVNHGPFFLKLVPLKTRIYQFIFELVKTLPDKPLDSVFQGQTDPTGGSS